MDELVPPTFAATISGRRPDPQISGDDWLRRLPRLVGDAMDRWELTPDGASLHGQCALVVPVRRRGGVAAVLKVTWPHPEARHEHLALRAWNGRSAVRLLAADPATWTMLLARLDADTDLVTTPIEDACTTIGTLLAALERPGLPQLDRLSELLATFLQEPAHPALPRRFVEQARSLGRDLAGDDDVEPSLLHTDLHYENVLAVPGSGRREAVEGGAAAWRTIDPKPMSGDRAYEVWPALHNRWDEIDGDAKWETGCRLGWICDAAGIDENRARAWAIIRTVRTATWQAELGADLTRWITLLKALQPGW